MKDLINKIIKSVISFMLVFSMITISTVEGASTYNIRINVTYNQTDARSMLSLVNELRSDVGVSSLTYDYTLEKAAMQRAAEIAIYFSHTRPNEESCFTVFDDYSITYTAAGENIAAGFTSVSSVFAGWKASSGHYANMVKSSFNAIGIGYCVYNGRTYWVQLFAKESSKNTTKTTANDSSTNVVIEVSSNIYETDCDDNGHTYSSWTVTKQATTSANGSRYRTCSVCNGYFTQTISKISSVSLSSTSYEYDGTTKTPTITIKDSSGNKLTKDTDYTVSGTTSASEIGTYTITITFKGKYSGSVSKSYTISYRSLSKATASLSTTTYTYNGKTRKPSVTVKYSGTTLTKNTDYTVTYASGRKNAGVYKVTIKGKGIYSGTITKYFYIKPKKVTISSAKSSSSKKLTVKWKKPTGGAGSGYQIAYKKKGASSWTYKKVSSSTLSKTLTGLTKGKYYYVKVRGYVKNGSTYKYGTWSSTKKVKVK